MKAAGGTRRDTFAAIGNGVCAHKSSVSARATRGGQGTAWHRFGWPAFSALQTRGADRYRSTGHRVVTIFPMRFDACKAGVASCRFPLGN